MFSNNLKIFYRRALKDKLYIITVLIGLISAYTACILIYFYVHDENTYDQFHNKADRIVRVAYVDSHGDQPFRSYYTPPITPILFAEIPEVETFLRIRKVSPVIRRGQNLFQETEGIFAQEDFFHVFDYTFIEGNPENALTDKYSIVLTKSRAQRYFGDEPALGKTLILNATEVYNEQPFTVTGVIDDLPVNTSYLYDIILSHQSMRGHFNGGDLTQVWAASFALLRDSKKGNLYEPADKTAGPKQSVFRADK